MPIISLLHDTHVLILMADKKTQGVLGRSFESMGATIHTAQSQNEAIGLYWKLWKAGTRPRVVVTSWSLTPQDSKEYKYLELIGRHEIDGTALSLLVNITDLDPTAFCAVYTQDPIQAREILCKANLGVEVFSRHEIEPIEFVAQIATHPGIATQRVSADEIGTEIRRREAARRLTTKSSPELPALTPRVRFG